MKVLLLTYNAIKIKFGWNWKYTSVHSTEINLALVSLFPFQGYSGNAWGGHT